MSQSLSHRRAFLADVGRGMLVAGLGVSAATEFGILGNAWADEPAPSGRITFGPREPLVSLVQETPADKLLSVLAKSVRDGVQLQELVAAAALANARRFGGEDYIGFHTFMALAPSLAMSQDLPPAHRALPVMKVLYRNASRIQEAGGPMKEVLGPIEPAAAVEGRNADAIRDAVHRLDPVAAERVLARADGPEAAWNDVLETVEEASEVHRVVLAHRAWDMLQLVGEEHATTMLRQSVRYCVKVEGPRAKYFSAVPALLAKLLDQYKLEGRPRGTKPAEDAWIREFSETLFRSTPEQAAEAVAAALAEGFGPESLCDAVSLAANELLLRDAGRQGIEIQPNKPAGSVHGDSVGLHSCDTANAWRHIALASNARNSAASLILSGYHVAKDRINSRRNWLEWKPRPYAEALEKVTVTAPDELLKQLDGAVRDKDQDRACAIAQKYLDLGHAPRAAFDALLKYAISEDGALHAEKFYRTATNEFSLLPSAFRDRQLVALARVSASQYGYPAPGYEEAKALLES